MEGFIQNSTKTNETWRCLLICGRHEVAGQRLNHYRP
jgi:hypothetical protein